MTKSKLQPLTPSSYISLIVIGISIGVLIGLSISPVISIIISSVMATAAAIVAAMSGLQQLNDNTDDKQPTTNRWQINPAPFAWLVLGLLIGAGLGITARNTHLLGSDVSIEVNKWSMTNLTEEEIAKQIFEARYPENGQTSDQSKSERSTPSGPGGTVLFFNVSSDKCGELLDASIRLQLDIDDLKKNLGDDNQSLDNISTAAEDLVVMIRDDICSKSKEEN